MRMKSIASLHAIIPATDVCQENTSLVVHFPHEFWTVLPKTECRPCRYLPFAVKREYSAVRAQFFRKSLGAVEPGTSSELSGSLTGSTGPRSVTLGDAITAARMWSALGQRLLVFRSGAVF